MAVTPLTLCLVQDHVKEESCIHKINGSDAVNVVPENKPDHVEEEAGLGMCWG